MIKSDETSPRRRTRVTIVDVAEKAGVHVSTASRALSLRSDHRISPAVVKKITRVAERLGYKRNPLAAGLRTQRTGSIGLVVPNLSDPLFAPIIASVQQRVAESGYVTFVASSDYRSDKLLSIIEIMSRHLVAGLVVASFDLGDPAAALCIELKIPTVAVLRDPRHPAISSVTMDDESGVQALVDHAIDLGHQSIAYITAPLDASTAQNRLEGFKAGMRRDGRAHIRFDIIEAEAYDMAAGERVVRELIANGLSWTAVLCFNDLLAVGTMVALKAAGMACPDDVSVAGVNNLPFMDLLSPPLTTLHNAGTEIGSRGAAILMKLIETGGGAVQRILLPTHPVIRGSMGPVPTDTATRHRPLRPAAKKRAAPGNGTPRGQTVPALPRTEDMASPAPRNVIRHSKKTKRS